MTPQVLLVGNLTVGFHVVGPFDNYTLAYEYAMEHVSDPHAWFIMSVYAPETE